MRILSVALNKVYRYSYPSGTLVYTLNLTNNTNGGIATSPPSPLGVWHT